MAEQLSVAEAGPQPILLGRHLIDQGMQPGPQFGALLHVAFDAQLDGMFDDLSGALAWLAHNHARAGSSESPAGLCQ